MREVMADGGYRGNPDAIIPYRKPTDGSELPPWIQIDAYDVMMANW